MVPDSALVLAGDSMAVFVVSADSIAHQRIVTVGVRQGGRAAVQGSLAPGDRVVTSGAFGLQDGMRSGAANLQHQVSIATLVERYRAAVYLLVGLLSAGGIYALSTLPAGIYPEVAYPRIIVLGRGGTFEAQEMVIAATRPLEQAMSGLLDLRKLRARTVRGGVELSLDFLPRADMALALSQVQSRLAALQPSLPADIELSAERLTPSVFPVLQYELVGRIGRPAGLG